MSKSAKFSPSAPFIAAAVAAALLSSSCFFADGDGAGSAMVRFTWETTQMNRGNIREIIAGYEDVRSWYDNVYNAPGFTGDGVAGRPENGGSYDIRSKIYSYNSPQEATKYKGIYLPVSKGKYTAVCAVRNSRDETVYIVANYEIEAGAGGAVRYYEVAFDVKAFLDGENASGWKWGDYGEDKRADTLLLQKVPGGGF
jgi:hypothetical protein